MRLDDARITILANDGEVKIELKDAKSSITFARVSMTAEQFVRALSRTSYCDCDCEVFSLEKIGKQHENKTFEFEIPKFEYNERHAKTAEIAKAVCPDGWLPDTYFGSKDSFFEKDGKFYARCTIRRWI